MARRRSAGDVADDDRRDTVQFDPADVAAARPSDGPDFADAQATQVQPAYADSAYTEPAYGQPAFGQPAFDQPAFDQPGAARSASGSDLADQAGAPAGDLSADEPSTADDPDYDRASSAINAARSGTPGEESWRRSPADDDFTARGSAEPARGSAEPAREFAEPADRDFAEPAVLDFAGPAARDFAGPAAAGDDFAEPAADDPDDEPLPQAVQPTDAVRVARLDAEVLVVDGRPRYHVSDCPSLTGRLAEPIPVREAVELGFSPCGLCRPVDRLVGAAVRR
nr:hypothetical protein [Actinoplanes sp. M2I2]